MQDEVRVTLRLPGAVHNAAARKLLDLRGVTFQSLLAGWVSEWLAGGKDTAKVPVEEGKWTEEHAMLDKAMADPKVRDHIRCTLKLWAR